MPQPLPLTIIIVDKTEAMKTIAVKDYKEEDLYKKCGFKNSSGFSLQAEWDVKIEGQKYVVAMYGKLDGKSNMVNKYDWPPPVDNQLYFGSCCLVGAIRGEHDNKKVPTNLSIELWNKIYEKLFGGFEDLTAKNDDDDEEDELDVIPASKKTKKGGYLKDGFVVDSASDTEELDDSNDSDDNDEDDGNNEDEDKNGANDEELILDVGSELSEEAYEDE
jgi:hypothetical protein